MLYIDTNEAFSVDTYQYKTTDYHTLIFTGGTMYSYTIVFDIYCTINVVWKWYLCGKPRYFPKYCGTHKCSANLDN